MQQIEPKKGKEPVLNHELKGLRKWWNRRQVKKYDKRYDKYDQLRWHNFKVFLTFIAIGLGIVIYSNVTPRPSGLESTLLNEPQPFGDNGKTATLVRKTYNPSNNTLLLDFTLSSDNDDSASAIDTRSIKVSYDGDHYIGASTSAWMIPTSQKSFSIQFENLKGAWQDVRVNLNDKQIPAVNLNLPTAASSEKVDKTEAKENKVQASFIVNSDKLKIDSSLKHYNQQKLALRQVNLDILDQQKRVKVNQNSIVQAEKDAKSWQKDIDLQKSQSSLLTADEQQQVENTISTDNDKISDDNKSISDAKINIKNIQTKISKLEELKKNYERGDLNLPKPY